jgi:hypothetical protein
MLHEAKQLTSLPMYSPVRGESTMRRVLIIILFAMMPVTSSTESATGRDAVLKVVQIFFDAMTARDMEGARKIMVAEGRFHAVDMRKPKSDPLSFSNEDYFARPACHLR